MKRNLVVKGEPEQADISPTPSPVETQLATLRSAWSDALERERLSRQSIVNLSERIAELDLCIADAKLRSVAAVPINSNIQEISNHAKQKRLAIDESESLLDAKNELLKQLSKMESEYRGFGLERIGIRESLFRLFFDDLLQNNKPLFKRIWALGTQLGLSESTIAGEMFYGGCDDDLTDLLRELEIVS